MDITVKRKGMKKKGKGREMNEAKKKNSSKKLLALSVVMAAVLVSSVLVAFMPPAAADNGITNFEITPETCKPGEKSAYTVTLSTTGFDELDMWIPAGFKAEAPGCGELLAEVWLWDDASNEYYITLTSNCSNAIDVCCKCGGATLDYTFPASYGPGDTIDINVKCWSADAHASLTLPTGTEKGLLSMRSPKTLTKVVIRIGEFVRNPTTCGEYTFVLTVDDYPSKSDTVCVCSDLVITDIWLSEDNKIYYTIMNKGCCPTVVSYSSLEIDGRYLARDKVKELASGESLTESFERQFRPGEDVTVRVCADYQDRIEECNDSNNCREEDWPEVGPDLVIEDKSEEWTDETKGHYTVTYVIHNKGTEIALAGHDTTLYVDGVEIEHKHVPVNLMPCETYEDTFDTVIELTGDSDTIKVCADNFDKVKELSEANNCLENKWPMDGVVKPDLVITNIRIEDNKICYTIENKGDGRAERSYSGLYIRESPTTLRGRYSARDKVDPLEPNEKREECFERYRWTCSPPSDLIQVCADYQNRIDERVETNNCLEEERDCPLAAHFLSWLSQIFGTSETK